MSELCASQHEQISANFQNLTKVLEKFRSFAMIMPIKQKRLFLKKKFPSRCISSCQQDINLFNFPSKILTIEQLFCKTARWVRSSIMISIKLMYKVNEVTFTLSVSFKYTENYKPRLGLLCYHKMENFAKRLPV